MGFYLIYRKGFSFFFGLNWYRRLLSYLQNWLANLALWWWDLCLLNGLLKLSGRYLYISWSPRSWYLCFVMFPLLLLSKDVMPFLIWTWSIRDDHSLLITIPNSLGFRWLLCVELQLDILLVHHRSAGTIPVSDLILAFVGIVSILETALAPNHSRPLLSSWHSIW